MPATVLCADVDRNLFKILERALGDRGYRAIAAHDGDQALAAIGAETPDLLLLDLTLPKRDGFEVLAEIRGMQGKASALPVLLTCGSRITPQYEERAQALGAQGLLAKPVALDELLGRVSEYVKADPPPRTARSEEAEEVEGDLAEVGFAELLHHLHGLRANGVLLVSTARKKKAIELRDGHAVAVKSNLIGECLGNYLVRCGRLSQKVVDESLARMKKGEGLQGQILVAMDVISEKEITEALREQAESKLYEIFGWRRGSFRLEMGSRLKRGNTLTLETSPANIILQGLRNWTPVSQVEAFFAANRHRPVDRAQSPFYRFQDVNLDAAEAALVDGLDGSRTLEDLCGNDEAMRRTFQALVAAELLALGGEARPVDAKAAREAGANGDSAARTQAARRTEQAMREELTALAKSLRGKSYFEMLDVEPDAPLHKIESAFERLARRAHPDRFNSASEGVREMAAGIFEKVTEAHDTLVDPQRRLDYMAARQRGARAEATSDKGGSAAEAEFQQGELLLRQRDYQRALTHFTRAREARPRDGEYLAHYAWSYYLSNPDNATVVQESIVHMKRAVKLARDQEKPYLFLGRLCKVVGDMGLAQSMFTRAVQIRPDCVEAMRELRLINMRKDKGLIGKLLRR